jgi:uncharacterized integral membrane protein
MKVSTVVGWVLVALLTLFIFINWSYTNINVLWVARINMPVSLAMLASAALGFGAAVLLRMVKKDKK